MARYPLNLPVVLKQQAEQLAADQGVSLNQFILWAVSEKVASLRQQLDDPDFPHVIYRRGASGIPVPVVRGTGLRVQAVATAVEQWGLSPAETAAEYGLAEAQIADALAFSRAHRAEIDAAMAIEANLETSQVGTTHVAA